MSDLSPQAEALLEVARAGDDPTGDDRVRVRRALAARIAIGVAAGVAVATVSKSAASATAASTAAAATVSASVAPGAVGAATVAASAGTAGALGAGSAAGATFAGSALGAKLLVSLAVVGAVGAGTVTYTRHQAETRAAVGVEHVAAAPAPISRPALRPARAAAAPVQAPREEEAPLAAAPTSTPASTPTPTSTPTSSPTPTPTSTPTPTPTSTPSPARPSLSDEIALLQDAHVAIQAGDGRRALLLLDEHARRFPSGTLAEEREASRVFALCKLGRVDDARAQTADFLRDHPRSPQAPGVRASCGAPEEK